MPHLIDPCPFCGSTKTSLTSRYTFIGISVVCDDCDAQGPFKSRKHSGKELTETEAEIAAVNAWNNRK